MKKLICIVCPMGCHIEVDEENDYKVTGNKCPRGAIYGKKELTAPTRVVTSTIKISGGIHHRVPVKTAGDIPKELNFKCMDLISRLEVKSPVKMGDIVSKNVFNTGVDIVITRDM
ncbi:MAG TPA: molybdopterin oxidoreductase [Fusobacteriaceae bacterium]|jgi:CxxC motif-containing protein|nr:molybdopterin oxidoreductase [Fusobacteriaceae bacterium]